MLTFTALVYTSALNNKFVWDDSTFIFEWPLIRSFSNIPKFFIEGALPDAHLGDYRPLKGLILTIDFHLFGVNPRGYIIQAIAIHLLAVFFVYLVAKKLSRSIFVGCATAFLFGSHPVHVEAITFITSSTDVLGPAFAFASLYFYIRRYDYKSKRRRNGLWALIFATFAFMANEIVLILPVLFVLYDFLFQQSVRKNLRTYVPYFLLVAGVFFMRWFVIKNAVETAYFADSFVKNVLLMPTVILKYIQLLFLPVDLSVNHLIRPGILALRYVDFNPDAVGAVSILTPDIFLSAIVVFLLVGLSGFLLFKKRSSILTFCLGWFWVTLLPTLNIIPIPIIMSERYIYFTSFGACLLIAWIVFGVRKKFYGSDFLSKYLQVGSMVLLGVVGLFFSQMTWMRNLDWKDSLALWGKTVKQVPESALAHNNLGNAYVARGMEEEALDEYQLALKYDTLNSSKINRNLGRVYLQQGELKKAQQHLTEALAIDPQNYLILMHLGELYRKLEKPPEAILYYKKSLAINPFNSEALAKLASTYASQKKYDQAIIYFERAIEFNQVYIPAYLDLAGIFENIDREPKALSLLERAHEVDPENPYVNERLSNLKAKNGL